MYVSNVWGPGLKTQAVRGPHTEPRALPPPAGRARRPEKGGIAKGPEHQAQNKRGRRRCVVTTDFVIYRLLIFSFVICLNG